VDKRYAAVLFDLLTTLLDSWTVWNRVAGGEAPGRRWRAAYLELTYGCGAYAPYESLVAGFYKPHPAPYRLALAELGLPAQEVLFVAGSGFDLIGTARVGLDTYWHNRVGLARPEATPAPLREAPTLEGLFS
jgi:FMN phosphatase YigB (HAD superfamily)